jgi:hypothetical protein
MVLWLCRHGIMPLYTPLGGSWLNMAESIQRILKRRTLAGQHPESPAQIGDWFEQTARAWNAQPTPFTWNGKRRQRRRKHPGDTYAISGSAAHARYPLLHRRTNYQEWQASCQMTHSYVRVQGFWARLPTSGLCRSVRSDGIQRHGMGDGALRRRLIKLLCAGWRPHSVFRLGAIPV